MPDINTNFFGSQKDYKLADVSYSGLAYDINHNVNDYDSTYGFIDWANDAKSDFYRRVLEGEMNESQYEMTIARNNLSDVEDMLSYMESKQNAKKGDEPDHSAYDAALKRLRDTGVLSSKDIPSKDELIKIQKQNEKDYQEALNTYNTDKEQLQDSYKNYDISQYYTRKSNETVRSWGNWFYKLPSSMGSSNTSAGWQAIGTFGSMAGRYIGGAIGGFLAGVGAGAASVGTAAAPAAVGGASVGAAIGSFIGALPGNIMGRKYESQMEAFNAYYERVIDEAKAGKIDLEKVVNNVRQQLLNKGENLTGFTDEMLLNRLISDKELSSGSIELDKIINKNYQGSLGVFDLNLGELSYEVASDVIATSPVGKIISSPFKGVLKIGKKMADTGRIGGFFTRRFREGLKVSQAAANFRSKTLINDLYHAAVKKTFFTSVEEGSEEGNQAMIVDKYKRGEYDDLTFDSSILDYYMPISGNSNQLDDIIDNTWMRARAIGVTLNLDAEYKNDRQIHEEILSGMLLPILDHRSVVTKVKDAYDITKRFQASKYVADYAASTLEVLDRATRNESFYKTIREHGIGFNRFTELLNEFKEELKSTDSLGKTKKYKLDSTAITEDGSVPTDADIDKHFDQQVKNISLLKSVKDGSKKQLRKLSLNPEEEDTFLALKSITTEDAIDLAMINLNLAMSNTKQKIFETEEFKGLVKNLREKYGFSEDATLTVNELVYLDFLQSELGEIVGTNLNGLVQATRFFNDGKMSKETIDSLTKSLEEFRELQFQYADSYHELSSALLEAQGSEIDIFDDYELSLKPEDTQELTLYIRQVLGYAALQNANSKKLETLNSNNTDEIRSLITKFKDAIRQQDKLASEADEAARTNTEIQVTPYENQKVTDLSKDLLRELRDKANEYVNRNISSLQSLLATITPDSPLRILTDRLVELQELSNGDNRVFAKSAAQAIKNKKDELSKLNKDGNLTDEEKATIEQLLKLANHLETQLNEIQRVDLENKARIEEHDPLLKANSSVYVDPVTGKRYTFNTKEARYSEDGGLVLQMEEINENAEEYRKKAKQFDEIAEELYAEGQYEEADKYKEIADSYRLRQKNSITTLPVNDSNREELSRLETRDNEGKITTFGKKLAEYEETARKAIEANKKARRNKDIPLETVDGDTHEFNANSTAKWKHMNKNEKKYTASGEVLTKAYPEDTPNGRRVRTKLLRPYHASMFWDGHVIVRFKSKEDAEKYLKQHNKVKIGNETFDRVEAVDKFHKIGQAIARLKANGTFDYNKYWEGIRGLMDGSIKKVKLTSKIDLTKDDILLLAKALPLQAKLYQPRAGSPLYLHVADLVSSAKNSKDNENELNSRINLVFNILSSYKEKDTTEKEDTGIGYDEDSAENDAFKYTYGVKINRGDVEVVPIAYNTKRKLVTDTTKRIFQHEDGTPFTSEELEAHHDKPTEDVLPEVDAKVDKLIALAKALGYSEAGLDGLNVVNPETGKSQLFYLVRSVLRYGDGVTGYGGLINVLRQTFGKHDKTDSGFKFTDISIALAFLSFFEDIVPEGFMSYQNYQDDNKLTPIVSQTVKEALSGRWFDSNTRDKSRLLVEYDGAPIDNTESEENANKLTELFELLEKYIRESRNAEEFLNKMHESLIRVKTVDGDYDIADQILREYFNNRRFSRLNIPTNIVNAITKGSPNPMQGKVDYEHLHKTTEAVKTGLLKVASLGLEVDEATGVTHISVAKWVDNQKVSEEKLEKTSGDLTSSNKSRITLEKEQVESEYNNDKSQVDNILTAKKDKTEKARLIMAQIRSRLPKEVWEQWMEEGDDVLFKKKEIRISEWHASISDALTEQYENKMTELNNKAIQASRMEKEMRDEKVELLEDPFPDKQHEPITLAYGSYEKANGKASVIYHDASGKHTMQNVSGTPGAVYMVIPSWMTPNRKKTVIHLYPSYYNEAIARVMATLLKGVQDGTIKRDAYLNEITLPDGTKIETGETVENMLSFMTHMGSDNILKNPTDENYERLLMFDRDGTVRFGNDVLTDENFEDLVNFIMTKKTMRVDREKLESSTKTNGVNIKITNKDGKVLYERKSEDNYVTTVLKEEVLTTDLDNTEGQNIFSSAAIYINYKGRREFQPAPNDESTEGTAANAKKNLQHDGEEMSSDEMELWLGSEMGKKPETSSSKSSSTGKKKVKKELSTEAKAKLSKYIEDLQRNFITKKLTDFVKSASVDLNTVKIAVFYKDKDGKTKRLHIQDYPIKTVEVSSIVDGKSVIDTQIDARFTGDLIGAIGAIILGQKDGYILLLDKDEKPIKVGDKTVSMHIDTDKVPEIFEKEAPTTDAKTDVLSGLAEALNLSPGTSITITIGGTPVTGSTPTSTVAPSTPAPTERVLISSDGSFIGKAEDSTPTKTVVTDTPTATDPVMVDPEDDDSSTTNFDISDTTDDTFILNLNGRKYSIKRGDHKEAEDAVNAILDQLDATGVLYDPEFDGLESYISSEVENWHKRKKSTASITPLTAAKAEESKVEEKKVESKPDETKTFTVPTYEEFVAWVKTLPDYDEDFAAVRTAFVRFQRTGDGYDQLDNAVRALFLKMLTSKKIMTVSQGSTFLASYTPEWFGKFKQTNIPNLGFYEKHVLTEDYESAVARAEKTLGKGFKLDFIPKLFKAYDKYRKAMIYVFGQTAASGMRIFRDAAGNVAKGVIDHEAYHTISLFVLHRKDRKKAYDELRAESPEYADLTDQLAEEVLADRYQQFVADQEQRKGGKFYSNNFIVRQFQKLYDYTTKALNRLFKAGITPRYTDLNKLFRDMYSGRYAYIEATKDNLELFQLAYAPHVPFSGFEIDGKVIAQDAEQYNEIFRDLLARAIKLINSRDLVNGKLKIDMAAVRLGLINELNTFKRELSSLDSGRLNPESDLMKTNSTGRINADAIKIAGLINMLNNILKDENWKVWDNTISDYVKRAFNLEKEKVNDPNAIFNEEVIEDEEGSKTDVDSNFIKDYERDSYATDHFTSMHLSMKLLLYSIANADPNKPETFKFTENGLIRYANPKELYHKIVNAVTGSRDTKEMMENLCKAAKTAANEEDYTLSMFYVTIQEEIDNKDFLVKLYNTFVKYNHKFINHGYNEHEQTVNGSTVTTMEGSVRRSDVNTATDSLQAKWKRGAALRLRTYGSKENWVKAAKEVVETLKFLNKALYGDPVVLNEGVRIFLLTAVQNFGIFNITDDIDKDTAILLKYIKKNGTTSISNIITKISTIKYNTISPKKEGARNADDIIKELFNVNGGNGPLLEIALDLAEYVKSTGINASQNGPGGKKYYSTGQYNFVTHMINLIMRSPDWIEVVKKNGYAQHSKWIDVLSKGGAVEFFTKLGTVLNDEYNDSTADISITPTEDMLNRFTSILNGHNTIPSLANKKFAGDIKGMFTFKDVVDKDGKFKKEVIETFEGYIADELLAVSDAIYLRKHFINELNRITHSSYTYETFSKLSGKEQNELFNKYPEAKKLLQLLVKQYHFKSKSQPRIIKTSKDGKTKRVVTRTFHIDLTSGTGYLFRHFKNIGSKINFESEIEALSADSLGEKLTTTITRNTAGEKALAIVKSAKIEPLIILMLNRNIVINIEYMRQLGLIDVNPVSISEATVDKSSIYNKFLPTNLIEKFAKENGLDPKAPGTIYAAIAKFSLQSMSDMIEFEKLIHGDIGYHKDITSVNKRYSGIVSTMDLTPDHGTIKNEFEDDILFESRTYNKMGVNTTKVFNWAAFTGDVMHAIGISVDLDSFLKRTDEGEVGIDPNELLVDTPEGKKLNPKITSKELVARFIEFRDKGLKMGMTDGKPATDEELAQRIVENVQTRFEGYLDIDPTDAQAIISPSMFRQLKQRSGEWSDYKEACYNILEHFDELDTIRKRNEDAFDRMLKLLYDHKVASLDKISRSEYKKGLEEFKAEVMSEFKKFKDRKGPKSRDIVRKYIGYIYSITPDFDCTPLKYVYYGDEEGHLTDLIRPIYDKMSELPLFKIFAYENQMSDLYKFMNPKGRKDEKNTTPIHMIAYESATKSAGDACFELFDEDGNIDAESLTNAPVRAQYFEFLGKQLNTDPHTDPHGSLLTQFMKIAVMNINPENEYEINGKKIKGAQIQAMYADILNELTTRGYEKFKKEFGITDSGLDKETYIKAIKRMLIDENTPLETVKAFATKDGKFIIHPALIPSMHLVQSKILSAMGKRVIDTTIKGIPLYQASSVGYDNILNVESHKDVHLLMPSEKDPKTGKVATRMQVKLSILLFNDIIKKAVKAGVVSDNFEDQRRWLLEHKELFALSYRVPTQGLNSTIPIEIVDFLPPHRGAIIHFAAGVTALTGSDRISLFKPV